MHEEHGGGHDTPAAAMTGMDHDAMPGIDHGMGAAQVRAPEDVADSLSLFGGVSLGLGIMIGAGIFVLTGQAADLAGDMFPVAFLVAAVVVAFSAYSYVKLSHAFPSSAGPAMFLREAYGPGTATGVLSLFMYVSMVLGQSLVARTFGAYILQIVDLKPASFWVPALGVALLAVAFMINIAGNRVIQAAEAVMAVIKIGGLALFAIVALWFVSSANFTNGSQGTETVTDGGFLAAVALVILVYKGFTVITTTGGEMVDARRNIGRAIIIAISISAVLYIGLAVTVAGNLTLTEIIAARDFALAEAARPAFGEAGVWFTVALAVVATASGVIASVFAASRMLAMLTRMKQVPYRSLGLPGTVRTHAMLYTVTFAMILTILFDLRRIAALGAIFYLIFDIAIHWAILRHLRSRIEVRPAIVGIAIVLDVIFLSAFVWVKASDDALVLFVSAVGIALIVAAERLFMWSHTDSEGHMDMDMDMDM
jgi:amino acid transporter